MSIERTNPITGTEAQRRWLQANAAVIEAAEEGASIGAQELHTSVDGAGLKRVFRCHENIGRTYHLGTVANEAAMLALDSPLTSHACLPGDTCFRTDTQQTMRCISNYGASLSDWEVVLPLPADLDGIRTLIEDRVPISTTRLGSVGNTPLTTTALTAADWAALPVGWSGIISADVAVASGLPAADVYHLHKVSARDVSGGGAYQAQGYLTPTLYVGVAATSSDLPTWSVALTSAPGTTVSAVGASLLNISTPAAPKIPRINPDGSATLIDVPSGGTDFSPGALSGLTAWFKADSGVLKTDGSPAGNGDSVATWQDQSGGGFHLAQVNSAKQPVLTPSAIGAYAALRFEAGARYMLTTTGPNMDLSELTIAVVFRSLSSEPYQRLVVLGPTGSTGEDWNTPARCMVSLADAGNCADFFANSTGVTIAGSRPPPPGVLIARISRGRMVLIADDVVRSSVASVSSLSTSVGLLLGAHYASGSVSPLYGLDGYIAEVALFSRALSDFECGQLSNYLARWLR